MTALEILRRARALTDWTPWRTGALVKKGSNGEIGYCLVGYLGTARGLTREAMEISPNYEEITTTEVANALAAVIREQYPNWSWFGEHENSETLWAWNDRVAESKEAVQRVMEKAIVKLEEQV